MKNTKLFPAVPLINSIIKAARAKKGAPPAIQHLKFDATRGFFYATDGRRLLRCTRAELGVDGTAELATALYDLAVVDNRPRLLPAAADPAAFPNAERVIPNQADVAFKMSYTYNKTDVIPASRAAFILQSMIFYNSQLRHPGDTRNWQILASDIFETLNDGQRWEITGHKTSDPVSCASGGVLLLLMPCRGFDQHARGDLQAAGLWREND